VSTDPHQFPTRLPPHVYRELESLFEDASRHFRRDIGNSDMVGALILRARRERPGLMEDLAAYLDVRDAWRKDGSEQLPDL
jgi:hypothetical protein